MMYLIEVSIGEVLIPILNAVKVPEEDMNKPSFEHCTQYRLQIPPIAQSSIRKTSTSTSTSSKSSQTICSCYTAYIQLFTCDVEIPEYDRSDQVNLKLVASMKPIQSADCSWPCRFMSKQLHGAEAEVFNFFPAHDGLHIFSMYGVDRKRHINGISSILMECLERKFISSSSGGGGDSNNIHLVIPYSQLDISEMHILTENMFLLIVSLHRCLPPSTTTGANSSSNSSSKGPSMIKHAIQCELLVGPCIANDLYALVHNRITLCIFRDTISSYVSSSSSIIVDKMTSSSNNTSIEDMEAFEHIAKDLQEEIYETILQIERFQPINHMDNMILHKTTEQSIILPFKLLYLKKAALKIYLWFLIGTRSDVYILNIISMI